ncbi:MAG: glycosyltransferase family 2 protein [Bacteroidales bacterium]
MEENMQAGGNRISVICVLYYSKHLLKELIGNIETVIGNKLGEIILVNNSSEEKLDHFQNPNIKIITPPKNIGYGGGMNLGAKQASFDHLLLINPDLELKEFKIDLNLYKDQLFFAGGYNLDSPYAHYFPSLLRDTLRISIRRFIPLRRMNSIIDVPHTRIKKELQHVDCFSGSLIFTNMKSFKLVNGFDENFFLFYEELDLCKRSNKKKIDVFTTQKIIYSHKINSSSSRNEVLKLKLRSELDSFFLYHSKYHQRTLGIASLFLKIFTLTSLPVILAIEFICPHQYFKNKKSILTFYYDYFFGKSVTD